MTAGELYVEVGDQSVDVVIPLHLQAEGWGEGQVLDLHRVYVHLLKKESMTLVKTSNQVSLIPEWQANDTARVWNYHPTGNGSAWFCWSTKSSIFRLFFFKIRTTIRAPWQLKVWTNWFSFRINSLGYESKNETIIQFAPLKTRKDFPPTACCQLILAC